MERFFSIIIPLFNKKKYIDRALNSVLKQTYKNFELIIINDGSSDGGENTIAKYNDDRIRTIHQNNMGVSAARNNGVFSSIYDYICFLDADDEWKPGFLREISSLIDDFSNYNIFSLRHEVLSTNGERIYPRIGLESGYRGPVENFSKLYANANGLINSSSVCLRKSYFIELGGFPNNQNFGEDTYLWLKSDIYNNLIFYDYIGGTYYRNANNNSLERIQEADLPYYIEHYFTKIKNGELKEKQKKSEILYYLRRQSILHIAGLINYGKSSVAFSHSKKILKLNVVTGIMCMLLISLPKKLIKFFGIRRNNSRKIT